MSQNTNSTKIQPATICRSFGCNSNLSAVDPASQYQRLKIIQKTVRVPASLYTHDLAALTVYQKPVRAFADVNWNQMSDRAVRHVQPSIVTGGSFYHGSSTKHSITRCRPGAGCPGGSGVDIKHNSYDRYLNRLKGKGPVRRGIIPPGFGTPLPFNPALPIYGGKTMKTSIVGDNCGCPIGSESNSRDLSKVYAILVNPVLLFEGFIFRVGDSAYALNSAGVYSRAVITSGGTPSADLNNKNGPYSVTIRFDNGTTSTTTTDKLLVYFPCNCDTGLAANGVVSTATSLTSGCYILNQFQGANGTYNLFNYVKYLLPAQYQNFLSNYNL